MIIRLKQADFSANNIGKIALPNVNLNLREGTNNPLLFNYTNTVGTGEFLGVEFVAKDNPSPFPIIRKLHKGGTEAYLYAFLTANRNSIDFPLTPSNLSMAIWLNFSKWESFQAGSSIDFNYQVYQNRWKFLSPKGGLAISYSRLLSQTEIIEDVANDYVSLTVKSKALATKVIGGETWVCLGFVFSNIQYNTDAYEAGCRPRISLRYNFMNSAEKDMEVANLQVVETSEYLNPYKNYE